MATTFALIAAQRQIEGKLTAWAQDLERLREGLATQLARLEQRQRQLISDAESRFASETERLVSETGVQISCVAYARRDASGRSSEQ